MHTRTKFDQADVRVLKFSRDQALHLASALIRAADDAIKNQAAAE